MPRKPSPTLTDAELRIMRILWGRGPSTVNDVVAAMPEDDRIAYTSALTTLRILEQKGVARRRKRGRAHVYAAVLEPDDARRSALRFVLDRFFDNSPQLLLANVIEEEDFAPSELDEIRRLLDGAASGSDDTPREGPSEDEVKP